MEPQDPWVSDAMEICHECEHPLCNGECESQAPSQLIVGGAIGAAVLLGALLIKVLS